MPISKQERGKYFITMQHEALRRGGELLSDVYINRTSKYSWKCLIGHTWEASWDSVSKGHWCHICSSGLGERICRAHFEQIFGHKFPKRHPHWLMGNLGKPLELDGFCESLKIAFEYQGLQHFKIGNIFNYQTDDWFEKILERDLIKRKMCEEKGIILFEIPELFTVIKLESLKSFIISQCEFKKIILSDTQKNKTIDLKDSYKGNTKLDRADNLAKQKGGRLIDSTLQTDLKYEWECDKKHTWKTTCASILKGSWCYECQGKTQWSLDKFKNLVESKGGILLSDTFKITGRVRLKCKEGHEWNAFSSSIVFGRWCKICSILNRKSKVFRTIEDMKRIAESRHGKCLSDIYIDNNTKLDWECARSHRWKAKPRSVINDRSWCKKCSYEARRKIK